MATLNIERVTALPGTLATNSIYVVSVGTDKAEIYVTGNTTTARRLLNETDIQALIDASISGIGAVEIVADIAARDALTLTANAQVMVLDASADATVSSGAATYIYRHSDTSFTKISEAEGLDVVLQWANIQGGPTSTAAQIDSAVSDSHTHSNKTQLDKVGENGSGQLTYDGDEFVLAGATDW